MKINMTKEVQKDSLISHIVLNSITTSVMSELAKKGETPDGIIFDIKMTADGHEVDLQSFVDHWQNQVERMIRKKAQEIVDEQFNDLQYKLNDLQERVNSEIEDRLEDWEKNNE